MDVGGVHQVSAVLLVEGGQIGDVLEVVGIQLPVLQGFVGLDVVVVLHHIQGVAVLCGLLLEVVQDLGVRGGAGADLDGLVARGVTGLPCARLPASRKASYCQHGGQA